MRACVVKLLSLLVSLKFQGVNKEQLENILDAAMHRLIGDDWTLLDLDVSERSLTHHLARYIQEFLPKDLNLNVDVEYNRHLDQIKRLDLPPRRATDRDIQATTVFPDIIVHKRNSDEENLLVIEVKKTNGDLEYDHKKLCAFREQLGYQYAAHVILGMNSSGVVESGVIWI